MMKQILHQIENSENLLLASHISPDGDAVGSLMAMGLSLEILGKKVTFYSESAIPAVYRFLPATGRIARSINPRNEFDVAVIMDCSSLDRVGNAVDIIEKIPMIINLDHHVTNSFFGHLQLVDTWACATAEIVYWLIKKMDIRINKAIATSIYTGILTDTGSFRFSNTNENAFSICREMMEYGVDPSYVAQHVYGFYSPGRLKLLNRALNSIEISENGKVSIMTLTQEMFRKTHSQAEDTEGFLNYARNIKDIKVAALIQEKPASGNNGVGKSRYHISLRSDGAVDVSAIAAEFGGGGHRTAAGFCIASSSEEIKSQLFELSEKI